MKEKLARGLIQVSMTLVIVQNLARRKIDISRPGI
jgi:hypothetical protein